MTTNDKADLMAADRSLVNALAGGDAAAAATWLDGAFNWIDSDGRVLDKQQVTQALPKPPFAEAGVTPLAFRHGDVAWVVVEQEKRFVLRLWVQRAEGWRLFVYHQVEQGGPSAPHGPGRKDWDNPCRSLPYEPRTDDERACLAAWQRLETAVMTHDPEEWARHVADEFVVVGAARRHTKADRKAVLEEQKRTDAASAPAPLVSAELHGFPEAIVMRCEHQPFHGKAARVSRVFIKRDGHWLMAVSFQTIRQDAPVITI